MNEKPLGFSEFVVPEETWLTKIARYVDRKNLMEFFCSAHDPMGVPILLSERVHSAREAAYRFVFSGSNILEDPKAFQAVKEISDSYRRIISKKVDIDELEIMRIDMMDRLRIEEAHLKTSMMKASMTIMAIAKEDFNPNEIYLDDDSMRGNKQQMADVGRL